MTEPVAFQCLDDYLALELSLSYHASDEGDDGPEDVGVVDGAEGGEEDRNCPVDHFLKVDGLLSA